MADATKPVYSHAVTVGAIFACAVIVILATPFVRLLNSFALDGWSFLPDGIAYFVVKVPLELMAGAGAGFVGVAASCALLKRADPSVVAYVVSTLYICLFGVVLWLAYATNTTLGNILLAVAQLVGTVAGLFVGREMALQNT